MHLNQCVVSLIAAAVFLALALPAYSGADRANRPAVRMLELAGSPEAIGNLWGKTNAASIEADFEQYFVKPARDANISDATLIERSSKFVEGAREIAPHWLTEAEAIADAAGLDRKLYIAYIGTVYRALFLNDECTSYAVSSAFTEGHRILFHKNRDNAPKVQSAAIITGSVKGVNKFITITDASVLACMMMVNDKGLAGSADTGGGLEVDKPKYRGLMNTFILRHIAERASTCGEALAVIEDFVKRGHYAGAKTGTHWLFVDRTGAILEVSNNSDTVAHRYHSDEKCYFSVRDDTPAAVALANRRDPVPFQLFHGVSRDPSICFDTSIAGMTVSIDAGRPDLLTSAWTSLPARGLSFVLLMGGVKTPLPLVDGTAYKLMNSITPEPAVLEQSDASTCAAAQKLAARMASFAEQGKADRIPGALDAWVRRSTAATLATMEQIRDSAAGK